MDAAQIEAACILRDTVGRGETNHHFTAAMTDVATQACKTHAAAADDARQLTACYRQIGRYDHDAATLIRGVLMNTALNLRTNRMTINTEVTEGSVVRLHQYTQVEYFPINFDLS